VNAQTPTTSERSGLSAEVLVTGAVLFVGAVAYWPLRGAPWIGDILTEEPVVGLVGYALGIVLLSVVAVRNAKPHRELSERLGSAGALGVIWASLPAAGGFVLLAKLGVVTEWLQGRELLGIVLYVAIFALSSGFGVLPTYAQAILGGWVFGFAVGFPAALAGFVGGSLVGYVVARRVAQDRVERVISENRRARAVHKALIGQSFWQTLGLVTLVRVPPNSPFALTNLVLSTSGVRKRIYLIGTAIGMAPRTGIAVGLAAAAAAQAATEGGNSIQDLTGKKPWMVVVGIFSTIVVLAIIAQIANRAIDRVTREHQEEEGEAGESVEAEDKAEEP